MAKKLISSVFCIIFIIISVFPCGAVLYTPDNADAEVMYMISLDNGTVVVDVNSDQRVSPASITKIVTAILTIENCADYDEMVTVPEYCIRLLDGTNSSTAGILPGEQISVRDLLYCMLVYSGNDAANVLADYTGKGDIDRFIRMMNEFIAGLGCTSTHFVNPHGLDDPEHYTTAKDLSKIYAYCLKNSFFAEITGTLDYEVPATNYYDDIRYLRNTNGLLNPNIGDYYCKYVKTGKTGTTDEAGRCVISSSSYDGYNYLTVVMNAKFYDFDADGVDENMAFIEAKRLYEWAYENLRIREVANPETYVCEAEVRLAKDYDTVSLVPLRAVTALGPVAMNADNVFYEPYEETNLVLDAPVHKGDVVGKAAVKYAGETIAEVELVAAFDVQRSTFKYVGDLLLRILKSTAFKILLAVVFLVGLPVFILIFIVLPEKRRKKRNTIRMVNVNDPQSKKNKTESSGKKGY